METEEIVEQNSHRLVEHDQDMQQFLTFMMADEEYGVDILTVQEIRGWEAITAIPNAPAYVQGAINLRGTIVPIIDLRLRFGLKQADYGAVTVVIVVKVELNHGVKVMGLVVDAVSDVYSIDWQQAKDVPDVTQRENSEFVDGLVNVGEKMVVLLNLGRVLSLN